MMGDSKFEGVLRIVIRVFVKMSEWVFVGGSD